MKVLKRNGQTQEFSLEKIKTTLICTSTDIHQPLTDSDLNNLMDEIEKQVYKNFTDEVASKQIHFIVIETLNLMGFTNIAKAYNEFENSFVNK
jgi:transcriptional regulator NrdR family protein